MTKIIKKYKKMQEQERFSIFSVSKEVVPSLSLKADDKLDFGIQDGQVLLEKKLEIKSEHVPEMFYEEIDYFMIQHDQAFKNLIER